MSDIRTASELVRELYRHIGMLPVGEFKTWALARLGAALPFDSAFWAEGAEMGKVIFDAYLHNTRHPAGEWLQDYAGLKGNDPLADAVARNLGVTVYDVEVMPREAWLAHPEFGPFCRKHEIQYTLCTANLDPATTLIEVLSIYRASPEHPFSEEERRRMQFIFPHLVEARRRNFLAAGGAEGCGDGDGALAVCDREGRLRHADVRFTTQLLGAFPRWRGPTLPESFVPLLVGEGGEFPAPKGDALFQVSRRGDLHLLGLRRPSPIDTLTPGERRVAEVLVTGLSYRAGAEALGITPSTLNKHASRLYRKLEVAGRAALVSRFGEALRRGRGA